MLQLVFKFFLVCIFSSTFAFALKVENQSWAQLTSSNGKALVRIPGHMVPLTTSGKTLPEFVLIPHEASCLDVPPPGPSKSIYVKMQAGKTAQLSWKLVWVEGKITPNKTTVGKYGEVHYTMEATSAKEVAHAEEHEAEKLLPQMKKHVH